MLVVPLAVFEGHGSIPRSSDRVSRPVKETDIVVFVSHRWWSGEAATPHPDVNGSTCLKVSLNSNTPRLPSDLIPRTVLERQHLPTPSPVQDYMSWCPFDHPEATDDGQRNGPRRNLDRLCLY